MYAIKSSARLLLFSVFLFASMAASIARAESYGIRIDAQPLASALTQFAKQTGLQLLFESSLVADKVSPQVVGDYAPRDALTLILMGSGLGFEFANAATVTIQALKPVARAKSSVAENNLPPKESYVIEEVVVTAQKRGQSLQDVSIAISVFGEQSLRRLGIRTANDLGAYTSNLNVKNSTGNGNPIFTLRGLGVSTFASNTHPSVGMYIDEIYLPSNNMMGFQIFDLERVEVLKGPQGTVFGRNTTGGAVSFITKKPTLEERDSYLSAGLGNYDANRLEGALNSILSDTLAFRVAVSSQRQTEGVMYNRMTGNDVGEVDRLYGRLSLLWAPTENLSLNANFHAGRDKSNNGPWQSVGDNDPNAGTLDVDWPGGVKFINNCAAHTNGDAAGAIANCVDVSGYRDSDGDDPFEGEFSGVSPSRVNSLGAVVSISWDFNEHYNLTSVTGFEKSQRNVTEDFDGGPARIGDITYDNDIEAFQQEFRLAGDSDLVDWMFGMFYSRDTNETFDLFGYSGRFLADLLVAFDQETETAAAYANTLWHMSERLKLVVGMRYTGEETHWDGSTSTVNLIAPQVELFGIEVDGPGILSGAQRDETINADELTYKLGVNYYIDKEVMLYANVSRGFKSGGFNGTWATSFEGTQPYDGEQLIAWEAGFKSTLLDGLMQFNGSFFSYDYTDIQVFGTDTQGRFGVSNAGDADILGFEIDLWYRPVRGLDIKVGFGFNDSEFVEYRSATDDFTGNALPSASKRSFNGLIRYEIPIMGGLVLAPMLDATYKSKTYYTPRNTDIEAQDDYTLVNARVSLRSPRDTWELALWAKNIEDKLYFSESFHSGSAGMTGRQPGMPRTYGVDFIYRFY